MIIYLSTYTTVELGMMAITKSSAFVAGATGGAMFPLNENQCLVSSDIDFKSPPKGVVRLYDTETEKDVSVDTTSVEAVNTELDTVLESDITGEELVRRLVKVEGNWGKLDSDTSDLWMGTEKIDITNKIGISDEIDAL